jgi:hypothetical protein
VYDSESNVLILIPRKGVNKKLSGQTWIFDLEVQTWEKRDGPPHGYGPAAYDTQSDRIIFFNGCTWHGGITLQLARWTANGQTWAYDYNTDTWTDMQPEESPYGLCMAGMVYDSESDRMILFSGTDTETDTDSLETWAYDFDTNTWTLMQPSGDPPPGADTFPMSYDEAADRVIVWRRDYDVSTFQSVYKIGVYDFNTNTWEQRQQETHPEAFLASAMTYEPETGLHILFGGYIKKWVANQELWGYSYDANIWKRIPSRNLPSDRGYHYMTFHEQAGVLVLFGGGPDEGILTNEMWVYDPDKSEWTDYTIKP